MSPDVPGIPAGFRLGSVACGIKKNSNPDLALILAPAGTSAAAVFTQNRLAAAPVAVAKRHLRASRGKIRAVITNSGNANCATGSEGAAHADATCLALAHALGIRSEAIIPASTGVIGVPLPIGRLEAGIPQVVAAAGDSRQHLDSFAAAILTTDTRAKLAHRRISASAPFDVKDAAGTSAQILGIAKGAGMIHPNMATMLAYILTDITARPVQLARTLRAAVRTTFNRISIDGDTSTNDMVILLASGASRLTITQPAVARAFSQRLEEVCASLAGQIVRDAEGMRHFVRLRVRDAGSIAEAEHVAAVIATSPLVKTAWAGADPNWGRILAVVGRCEVPIDIRKVDIDFGDMPVCRGGIQVPFDEDEAHRYLSRPEFDITVTLNRGAASLEYLTCDLTPEYVRINSDYRT